tara:strand:- start:19501 stop:20994 length:1494 start_codon:yes stop_codon:yes gene_type:complete
MNLELEDYKNTSINQLFNDILSTIEKYNNDEIMKQKIETLLKNIPKTIEQLKIKEDKRKTYIDEMNNEQDKFINNFLASYQYFYIPNEERYFFYNNKHYLVENEDDISHKILTSINGQLNNWKFKTSTTILKRIKEKHVFKSIPDSYTLQFILNKLYPLIFKSKEEAKYFLTVIGDNILKKNKEIHYFTNVYMKDFINTINNYGSHYFGNMDCNGNIKTKYYEHDLNLCRIINTQKSIQNKNDWMSFIKNHIIDIIVVSCHYSNRYENAELYLETINQSTILERITYLKKYNHDMIVKNFMNQYIEKCNSTSTHFISWKNMLFLWKNFLNSYQLPNIVYIQQLKVILSNEYNFNSEKEEFNAIISKYLPKISLFLDFFNSTFAPGEESFDISEIKLLYNDWLKENKHLLISIEDEEIYEILHYFNNYEIENEKHIFGLYCLKWDKKTEIENAVNNYMMTNFITNYEDVIPYDCYEYYVTNCQNKYKINKNYFINNIN